MRDSVRLFSYSGSARDQDNKAADEHIKILETWARPAQLLGIASSKENWDEMTRPGEGSAVYIIHSGDGE